MVPLKALCKKRAEENAAFYGENQISVNESGFPERMTDLPGVWAAGDCLRGVSSVAQAVADAAVFAAAVLGYPVGKPNRKAKAADFEDRRGILVEENGPCLGCQVTCQCCVDACPNRANVVIELPDGSVKNVSSGEVSVRGLYSYI